MAQLGKFERTVLDNQGDPLSGISVAIYNQGASLSAAGTNPYTVYDPGVLTTAYTVQRNTVSTSQKAVTVVGATSITLQGVGIGSLVANDRLVAVSPTPTLYFDATGTTSTGSNVLTTDANGYCTCWLIGGAYDVITSGTGYSTRLTTDFIVSGEKRQNNALDSPTNPLWIFGSSRALSNSPIVEWHNPTGTRKAYIGAFGDFTGRQGTFSGVLSTTSNFMVTGTSTLTGNTTVGGTLGVSGATTLAGLTATTGAFTGLLSGSAGLTISAGAVSLPVNAIVKTYTADGTADQTTANAVYAAGNYDNGSAKGYDITNCTVTFTPASTTSEIVVMAVVTHEPDVGVAAYQGYTAIRDGSGNILAEAGGYNSAGAVSLPEVNTMMYRVTGLSGSQTFKVSAQSQSANMRTLNATHAAKKRIARIIAVEYKF